MDPALGTRFQQIFQEYELYTPETDLGRLVENSPTPMTLSHSPHHQAVQAIYTSSLTLGHALSFSVDQPFFLTPRVTGRSAAELRRSGIQYMDSGGNAYVKFSGVLIDVRGRTPPTHFRPLHTNSTRSRNLFTAGRAQVIFALLSWPGLVTSPIRTIAHAAGVSVGQTQATLQELGAQGFLDQHQGTLLRRELLAERWADTYPTGLRNKLLLQVFHGDPGTSDLTADPSVHVSGERAAAWIRHPQSLSLYAPDLPRKLIMTNRWRTDGPPTIFIYRKFWNARESSKESSPWRLAPPLLIYADLKASNDSRQMEAAQMFKEEHAEIWHA